jgi:trimethylamine corrinoid protein
MSKQEEILVKLRNSISNFDRDAAKQTGKEVLENNVDPVAAIRTMAEAINELGRKFESQEIYLPELVMASDAMKSVIKILEPQMLKTGQKMEKLGTVVIGTVKGDIHSLGKDIVGTLLMAAGFDVKDLGVDVSPSRFIEEAEDMSADIIACSALMSTTVSVQKDVIEFLKAQGFRDTYKVLVGGGVVSRDYAEVIGADGYGMTANEAIGVAKKLLGKQ